MSLTQMAFDRKWTNATDFPSYEIHEDIVREDMQYLFDSIKDQFNHFINEELTAENTAFESTTGEITQTNVRDAIEFLYESMKQITIEGVSPGSIEFYMLKQTVGEEAVDTGAIRDEAVTTAKIKDGAVTLEKLATGSFGTAVIADGAITQDKMSNRSVGSSQLLPNCVDSAKLADEAVITRRIAEGAVTYAKTTGLQREHNIIGPITVAVDAWDSDTKKVNVGVTGVSLTDIATQRVDWTPADRETWEAVRDNGIWVLRIPPANNYVTLECEKIPEVSLTLYFCIWD